MGRGRTLTGRNEAVLDTSFWSVGFRVGLIGFAIELFHLVVPQTVQDEIRHPTPGRIYPQQALFNSIAASHWSPAPPPEPQPIAMFGAGEASAIAVAGQLGLPLLVNEWRAAQFAQNASNIPYVITLPELVVLLTSKGTIDKRLAQALLRDCELQKTSPAVVGAAQRIILVL